MERIAAEELSAIINFWLAKCQEIEEIKRLKWHDEILMDNLKALWEGTDYPELYNKFVAELENNIREYQNADYMLSYLEGAFPFFSSYEPDDELEHGIIRNGFEVRFLLEVIKKTRSAAEEVLALYETDDPNQRFTPAFKVLFHDAMIGISPEFSNDYFRQLEEEEEEVEVIPQTGTFSYSDFYFDEFKQQLNSIKTNDQKIKRIQDKLIDYEQWFITLDADYCMDILGSSRIRFTEFYRLCKAELRRYEAEDQQLKPTATPITDIGSEYKWAASATDLLELVVALMELGAIKRVDGEKPSRKELVEYAETRLNTEIKDPEGKLTKATARKSNLTPFLDRLKLAFDNYAEVKDEKQRKRK